MNDTTPTSPPASRVRLTPIPDSDRCLDTQRLYDLEQSFRQWAKSSNRPDVRSSRDRILLIFLIIRYTGARLSEVLNLNLAQDFDLKNTALRFCKKQGGKDASGREVQIPETISADIEALAAELRLTWPDEAMFRIDPAHVRRKFYQQAESLGIQSALAAPDAIRKSRAVELLHSNMPLQVVQKILGHSTPNLTASFVEFSDTEISHVAKYFADRESNRKTSARNSFYGKISSIRKGTIQTLVEVVSVSGNRITSNITTNSLKRIGLTEGMLVTAEVKAPWIHLCRSRNAPNCSAENMFHGAVCHIAGNRTAAEVVVRLEDGTELCAIISEKARKQMDIKDHDPLWAFFNAFAVVLHVE